MQWLCFLIITFSLFNMRKDFNRPDSGDPFHIYAGDTNVSKRYIKLFDRDIENALKSFDPQTGLIEVFIPENAVTKDPLTEKLSSTAKKKIADNPEYIWSYRQSRGSAQLAGALSFAYSIKQSRHFRSSEILTYIKKILRVFSEHQAESGEFIFSPIHYSTVWGTHEMAWRLEPLMYAFKNIKNDLSASEKQSFAAMLSQAMDFLYRNENSSLSNRGVVWCGVMAMCYRFSGEEKYLQAANQRFQWVGRLFNADGEVREGPGPDLGYSTVSLQYLFLYRLMSGDTSLDSVLVKSLQWYTRMFTMNAVPMEGMTTRTWFSNGTVVSGILGALAFYSDHDPSFGQIAIRYLEALEKLPAGFTLAHGGSYFLWGAQYQPIVKEIKKIPYQSYARLYKSDHSLYFLIGANYQTAVTLRGRKPLKGLQTWNYKGQPPLIFPTRLRQSFSRGSGFDSHLMDVPWDVSPNAYRVSRIGKGIDVLVCATGSLSTAYVFANDITVVIYHSQEPGINTEWVSSGPAAAQFDRVEGQKIIFKNSEATIIFDGAAPFVVRENETSIYRFITSGKRCWFAFAAPAATVQVKGISEGLISITIKQTDAIPLSIVINITAETIVPDAESLNLPDRGPLLPYEAILIK